MHRHVRKYRANPGVIILCTGDGKGYYNDQGFLYDVEGFLKDGWNIEILSWTHSCHGKMKQFAEDNGLFIPLEEFYSSITFIQGGRRALPVNLNNN